ncbi:PLP-dependent aminotransferase family protein [Pararobbsia alpina]|uniref:HTH-type transcriptional regulator NorG n=1 Tax=Pararobbsia alpina TaxID=621374 RepID=A0A6S7BH92_9BURK|nr:PLP-dependent aminotransferase family protein [Pararobbsia alpina]CAB3791118.1 HTH-type transcriptional regulator NorG [Pararobbsia alpina]
MKRYEQLAGQIEELIRCGQLRAGARLPSIRIACRLYSASRTTVFRAYYKLESQGLIVAHARSGYFVSDTIRQEREISYEPLATQRTQPLVNVDNLVFHMLGSLKHTYVAELGSPSPSPELFPVGRIGRAVAAACRSMTFADAMTGQPPGDESLRQQIALRYLIRGMVVPVNEIIITSGAIDALTHSLQILTRAGDVVAIGSPVFYGVSRAVERLQLKVVEIPIDPNDGLDLDALAEALERHPVRACWFMTSFQNPTGVTMSDAKKEALVELLAMHDVPLIEDDMYGDLHFGAVPSRPAKFFDRQGLVLHCGSFSESLAPGHRVGWIAAGRFAQQIERVTWMAPISANVATQRAIANYLEGGSYERFLRGLRKELQTLQSHMLRAIARYFPSQTKSVRPMGGYFLWLELPPQVNSIQLFEDALAQSISLAPGPIFSTKGEFQGHIRLNYGHRWSQKIEEAIATLGDLAKNGNTQGGATG